MTKKMRKAAYAADGRSTRCSGCSLQPCRPAVFSACTKAFVEGFCKGAEYEKKRPSKTPSR